MTIQRWRRAGRLGAMLAFLALLPAIAQADTCKGAPNGGKITVVVDGLRSSQGLLTVSLYPEKGFLHKGGTLKNWRDPAKAGTQTMCVYLPPTAQPGLYAFGVYQDLNSDHHLSYNLIQGPTEPWGFSNNPRAIWPLPFKRVAVLAGKADIVLHVHLNN